MRRCHTFVILTRALRIKCPGNIRRSPDLHVAAIQPHPAQRALAQEIFERGAYQLWISLFIKGHEQRLPGQIPPPFKWNRNIGRIRAGSPASRSERNGVMVRASVRILRKRSRIGMMMSLPRARR